MEENNIQSAYDSAGGILVHERIIDQPQRDRNIITYLFYVYNGFIWAAYLLLISGVSTTLALADGHEARHEKHEMKYNDDIDNDSDKKNRIKPISNPNYADECGACHLAYPPGLLPSRSWRDIIAGLEDHFGENIVVDTQVKNEIILYLSSNAADSSTAEVSIKS